MADELEQQETPEVPEQAEFFTQTIGEAMAQPDPPPAPEPEPEPEPEAPAVEPSWLNEPQPAQYMPQAQYPQQRPDYPPVYQQQPQVQQGPASDAALNAFVENPDGWLDARLAERTGRLVGPLQQQQQAIAYMMNSMIENSINQSVSNADGAIKNAYEKFNRDSAFRTNKAMQNKIGSTLQGMREQAVAQARQGNFAPLNALSNLSEADIAGTLAYVRAVTGVQSPGADGPLQVEGAAVESSRSPVADQGVELTAEEQEIARRMGPGYADRMKKAKLEQTKYNDLEWKE